MGHKGTKTGSGRLLALFSALTWGFTMWSRTAFNYYTEGLGISASQLGIVNTATSIGSMLGAVLLCRYADKKNLRIETLGSGLILSAVMQIAICISPTMTGIIAARFVMGFGLGCAYSLTQAIVESASEPKERSANAGIVENGEAVISTMIGPVAIVFLISKFGWRRANALLIFPVMIIAAIWLFLGRRKERLGIRSDTTGDEKEKISFSVLLKNHNMKFCVVLAILTLTNIWTMYIYCPMYWTETGYSETAMSAIMTSMGVAAILACFILPTASNRFGRKKVAGLFAVLNTAAYLLMFILPGSGIALVFFVAFGGSACTLSMFFMALITSESVEPQYTASAISLVNASAELCGGAIGPLIAGNIADSFGIKNTMLFAAFCMGTAAILVCFLKETAPGLRKELAL